MITEQKIDEAVRKVEQIPCICEHCGWVGPLVSTLSQIYNGRFCCPGCGYEIFVDGRAVDGVKGFRGKANAAVTMSLNKQKAIDEMVKTEPEITCYEMGQRLGIAESIIKKYLDLKVSC